MGTSGMSALSPWLGAVAYRYCHYPLLGQQMLGGAQGPGSPGAQLKAGGELDVTYQPQRRDR